MRLPKDLRSEPVTVFIAAAIAAAWLLAWAGGWWWQALFELSFYPARLGGFGADSFLVPPPLTPLTATLVQWSFLHLVFNLLMLVLCGRPVERALGRLGAIVLYLAGAFASAAAYYAVDPGSQVPVAGANLAVSALVGAFALLFGRNRVKLDRPRLGTFVYILWVGAAWIGFQLLFVLASQGGRVAGIGEANLAGFAAGLLLARPLLLLRWRGA